MAWIFNVFPNDVEQIINKLCFEGTPSAKALKAFNISYGNNSTYSMNGISYKSYILVSACEESEYTHFTYLWFGDDSCPDCENGFDQSPRFARDDRGCGNCTILPLKCWLDERYYRLGRRFPNLRRHFYEGDSDLNEMD